MGVQAILDELMGWSLPPGTDAAIEKLDDLQAKVEGLIGRQLYDLPKEPNMRREKLIDLVVEYYETAK
jgi:hypothetical protein